MAENQSTFWSRWDIQVRSIPQLKNVHLPDIGRSYPLPAYDGERVQVRHFYHVASQTSGSTLYLGAPTVCAVLDYENGSLLDVFPAAELGLERFEDTTYRVRDDQKAALQTRARRVRELYDQVFELYPYQPGGEVGQEFWTAFQGMVPPPLLPYYRALSPDFVAWCEA